MDKNTGVILAWHNGRRSDEDFQLLLNYLESIPVDLYYSDDWGAYKRKLPETRHIIGKAYTWKIERKNLNFRTDIKRLNRKILCFQKARRLMRAYPKFCVNAKIS